MTLEFFVDKDDVVKLNEHLLARSPSQQAAVRQARIGSAAVVLATALVAAVVLRRWWLVLIGLALAVYAAAVTARETQLRVRKRTRELLNESPKEHWEGVQRVSATAEGIQISSNTGSGTMAWSLLERVDETDAHVFLCMGGVNGVVVPRLRLESGDLAAFVETCRARIAARGA
jgi:hypothetical protein